MFVFWISLKWPKGGKSKTKHCGILTRNTPSCSIFKFMSVTLPNMDAQDLKNPQKVLRKSQNWPSQGPKGNEFTWVKYRSWGFSSDVDNMLLSGSQLIEFEKTLGVCRKSGHEVTLNVFLVLFYYNNDFLISVSVN